MAAHKPKIGVLPFSSLLCSCCTQIPAISLLVAFTSPQADYLNKSEYV